INLLMLGDTADIILATVTACFAIVALVAGVGGWILRPANLIERGLLIVAAALLFYPDPIWDLVGLAFFVAGVMLHWSACAGRAARIRPPRRRSAEPDDRETGPRHPARACFFHAIACLCSAYGLL